MTLILFAVAVGLIAVARTVGRGWSESFDYAFAAMSVIWAVNHLTFRWRTGSVLLDMGPSRERVGGLILAPLALIWAVNQYTSNKLSSSVFAMSVAIITLITALGRREARESGILLDWSFTPWTCPLF